jgi:hypothetical protein
MTRMTRARFRDIFGATSPILFAVIAGLSAAAYTIC